MVSDVYMICVAYEGGVGKGRSGQKVRNLYGTSGAPVNAQCHEAWQHGYEFGQEGAQTPEDLTWYAAYRAGVESALAAKKNAWPAHCHSPSSCTRNRACMYTNCRHEGRDISAEIDAA